MTDAETCRSNGWLPGTKLIGEDQGDGESIVQITAIGETKVLAKVLESCSGGMRAEMAWTPRHRTWTVAT